MTRRVAIQMDPIASIRRASDSTLLMGLEAQRRRYELYYYTPEKLALEGSDVVARAQRLTLRAGEEYYTLGKESLLDLKKMDVVLLRQDPPFDMAYLGTTYLLERLLSKVRVVNHPAHVREQPEKLFPTLFARFTPPTLITADAVQIAAFRKEHKDIVIKPLFGFGGHGVLRLKKDDANFSALMEMLFEKSKEPWVAQPFLPEVKNGERRIILIDGKFAGIVGRIPAPGEIRSNFRVGGKPAKVVATKRQREVCEAVGPVLKKKGILFAGLDMIGDWLTEINITSPTGLSAINKLYGKKLEAELWDAIEEYL